jgi:hypothetical protein
MGFFKRLLGGTAPVANGGAAPVRDHGRDQDRGQGRPATARAPALGPPRVASPSWLQWPTIAWGSLHSVAGESYRQEELRQVLAAAADDGPGRLVTAQLVREPTNPHDPDAVRVEVGGAHVGYLPAALARSSHGLVDALHQSGRPATCRAELTGGTGGKPNVGITLHVANPWTPFVEGTPFLDGTRCTSVTVTKEERYQNPLGTALALHGEATVAAELSIGPDGKVDVHVDRLLVGHLTPRMSERHAARLLLIRDAGLPCSCPARLRRDDKGIVQVTLTVQT